MPSRSQGHACLGLVDLRLVSHQGQEGTKCLVVGSWQVDSTMVSVAQAL